MTAEVSRSPRSSRPPMTAAAPAVCAASAAVFRPAISGTVSGARRRWTRRVRAAVRASLRGKRESRRTFPRQPDALALAEQEGCYIKALDTAGRLLRARGRVLPASVQALRLEGERWTARGSPANRGSAWPRRHPSCLARTRCGGGDARRLRCARSGGSHRARSGKPVYQLASGASGGRRREGGARSVGAQAPGRQHH